MNATRWLAGLVCFVSTLGLWAQNPVLELERGEPDGGAIWTGRTPLTFRVTVLHPSMRRGGTEDEFVVDPPGGWRGALQLFVTDAAGKPVNWPFVNMGKESGQPLSLHRLGTASGFFLLEPAKNGPVFPAGKYQVRARLASTAGKWRGSVDSPPVSVQVIGGEQPGLEVTGLNEGPLLRGWPLLIGVKLTAPSGYDGGLALPREEKDWPKVLSLTLADSAGAPVDLPIERFPWTRADEARSQLKVFETRTIWFRVTGEATRSLGQGPYRWVAKFTLPASSNRNQYLWSGSVSAMTEPTPLVAPPMPLPAELARRQTWAQVEDLLVEAKLIHDRNENGYMNNRMTAARQSAVPLLEAERLARKWYNDHPDDPGGALLVANVMAAQEDKARALDYTQRAIDAEQRQRAAGGGAAANSSLGLRLRARAFEAMPDERHATLTPELRTELKKIRGGGTPPTPATATTPVPAPAPIVSAQAVPVPPAPVAPNSAPVSASPGKLVPKVELTDAKILADAAGQWAAKAQAKTSYSSPEYGAVKATGAPDVPVAGNSSNAWCPAVRDQGMDWLEVTFAKPVPATEVRVRQPDASGAIVKVEAIEPDGTSHMWWEGVDPSQSPGREIIWFAVRVPKTSYAVARVKITLNLASGPGYKEIDAVQLVAGTSPAPATSTPPVPAPAPVVSAQAAPVPTAPVAPNSAPVSASPGKLVPKVELTDAKILADAAGQWAAKAQAKTSYSSPEYGAVKATGAPDVLVAGNSSDAWCPAVRDQGMDWLEVTFAKPVPATEVRVRQPDASGAIVKVEAIEPDGTSHVWWEGVDPSQSPGREIIWFAVRVPKTSYAVARVKLTLNLASGPGYKEIDAVQLVAGP